MRRLAFVVVLLAAAGSAAPAGAAQTAAGCAGLVPGASFDTQASAGPVVVRGSGLNLAMTQRYAGSFAQVVEWMDADIADLTGVEVCIFSDELPLDAEALGWYPGQELRAGAFGEQGVVVLSAWQPGLVTTAGNVGLIHVALWRASGGSYPQPFGDDVMGWYLGRLGGLTQEIHNVYLRQQLGMREPWPPFAWASTRIDDPILWNPEIGYGGSGDFTRYVVGVEGASFLADPDPALLTQLDEGWRNALFDESGAIRGGSKGWIIGVIATGGLLLAAIAFAFWGRASRRRAEAALRELSSHSQPPDEPLQPVGAVHPLVGGGLRGGEARVGGAAAPPVGRDGDEGDRSPAGGGRRARRHRVPKAGKSGDDIFRHPDFREDD
jgi:hypothetical protein